MSIKNIRKLNIYRFVLLFIFLLTFFAFNINGRDYVGIIVMYLSLFIFLFKVKFKFDTALLYIIIYSFFVIAIDVVSLFSFPSSLMYIVRIFVYALIPISSYLIGNVFSQKIESKFFEKVILFIGIVEAIFGLLQVYSNKFRIFSLTMYADFEKYNYGFEAWSVGRAVGTLGNPNTYGIFMVVIILFITNVIIPQYHKRKGKVIMLGVLGLPLYAMVLSQSRTAYLLLVLGVVLSILFRQKNKLRNFVLLCFVIVLILVIVSRVPFLTRRFNFESLLSFGSRLPIWQMFINEYLYPINLRLFFGYGSGFVRGINKSVDNYYLQILLQYGLIGLALYKIMIIKLLSQFKRIGDRNRRNFLFITYLIVLASDFLGSVNQHADFTIFLFIIFGYYTKKHIEHLTPMNKLNQEGRYK